MEEVIKLNAVDQYNKMFGLETLHPLVSVVDLSEATGYPRHFTLNYGVYALFLKNTKCGDIRYGKQYYDYQEGTVTSFAPGQVTEVNMLEGMQPSASGLLFHPDLIKGTPNGTRKPRPRVQLHGGDLNQRQNHKGNSSAACYLSDCHSVTSRK